MSQESQPIISADPQCPAAAVLAGLLVNAVFGWWLADVRRA
jgi:hypothetical protein